MRGVMHKSHTVIPPTPAVYSDESRAVVAWRGKDRRPLLPVTDIFCFLFVTGGFTDIYNGHISNDIYLDAVYHIEIIPQ